MKSKTVFCTALALFAGGFLSAQTFNGEKYSAKVSQDGRLLDIKIASVRLFESEGASAAFYKKNAEGKQVLGRAFMISDWKNKVFVEKTEKGLCVTKRGTLNEEGTVNPIFDFEVKKELFRDRIQVKYKFTQLCDLSYDRPIVSSTFTGCAKELAGISVKSENNGKNIYTTVSESSPVKSGLGGGQRIRLTSLEGKMTVSACGKEQLSIYDARSWKDDHVYLEVRPQITDGKTGTRIFPKGTVWEWSFSIQFE